jgi:hypothetical protein
MPGLIVAAIVFGFLHIFLQSALHYQTESVTLKGKHMLTAFGNSVVKRIFGTETEEKKSKQRLKKCVWRTS